MLISDGRLSYSCCSDLTAIEKGVDLSTKRVETMFVAQSEVV